MSPYINYHFVSRFCIFAYYIQFFLIFICHFENNAYICIVIKNEDVSLFKIYNYGTRIIFFSSVGVFSSN